MKKEAERYVVRFTQVSGQYADFVVFAYNQREAIMLAKYDAGRAKIPVIECKVEVR